jgi:Uma2 family endonuclease
MAVELKRHKFTALEYHWMGRVGILPEDSSVELIDGEIVEMPPIGDDHAGSSVGLTHLLVSRFGDVAEVSIQNPVRVNRNSEPLPDAALLHRRTARFSIPTPDQVFLVIEIAQSSLSYDRGVKIPLYGRSGVPEAWLIDLTSRLLFVYREPGADGYAVVLTRRAGDTIAPLAFPDRELSVADIVGG